MKQFFGFLYVALVNERQRQFFAIIKRGHEIADLFA